MYSGARYLLLTPCIVNPRSLVGSKYKESEVGFPIRKSADQSLFAAPHGLSQRTTSFIACAYQGIHRTPLIHFFALIINDRSAAQRAARGQKHNDRGRRPARADRSPSHRSIPTQAGIAIRPKTLGRVSGPPARQNAMQAFRPPKGGPERPVSHENFPCRPATPDQPEKLFSSRCQQTGGSQAQTPKPPQTFVPRQAASNSAF